MNSICNPKHHEVTLEIIDGFMGLPPKENPNLIRLKEAGLTLARRVFHPIQVWSLKVANTYLSKTLSLVKERME